MRCRVVLGCPLKLWLESWRVQLSILTVKGILVGALSAKIEINNCSIRNIFLRVKLKIRTDSIKCRPNKKSLQNCHCKVATSMIGARHKKPRHDLIVVLHSKSCDATEKVAARLLKTRDHRGGVDGRCTSTIF